MKLSAAATVLMLASANAFVPSGQRAFVTRVAMSDEPAEDAAPTPVATPDPPAPPAPKASEGGALVPIKEETVEFTAGILGGAAGFVVGGPVLGAIGAAAANYASKNDGDVSDVIQAVSKSSIQVFNYLANLDSKYEVLGKAQGSLSDALDKLKKNPNVDPETLKKVEDALANTNSKISEINEEYDLVGGAVTALGVVGDLVEKAVTKAAELNKEYALSEKAMESLKAAVEKGKVAANKAAGDLK